MVEKCQSMGLLPPRGGLRGIEALGQVGIVGPQCINFNAFLNDSVFET